MKTQARFWNLLLCLALAAGGLALPAQKVFANGTAQPLPFTQDWTDTGLITVTDNWDGVPGILGYRGDGLTSAIDANPQTILAADSPGVLDINANQTNPNTFINGGITEFHITNPVVALSGSVTADAPYLLITLNTTSQENIQVNYDVRDIESSADDTTQQVALHYRVGTSGNFTNLPGGYVADATDDPALGLKVTHIAVTLPAEANGQAVVQLRIMTTNASGSDEWVGIDNISISGGALDPAPAVTGTSPVNGASGVALAADLTVTFSEAVNAPAAAFSLSCAGSGAHTFALGTTDNLTFTLNPDVNFSEGESCTATVLAAQVTDLDTNDPYDNMAADYVFTFTTYQADPAPTVASTVPVNNAVGIARGDNLSVTFSEAVNAAAGFQAITCASSGAHSATVTTGDSITYTLNPANDFGPSELCTVTLENTLVTDLSGQPMAADYTWSFTTADANCGDPYTPIFAIQGSGAEAAITGLVTTMGVVVGDYEGPSPALRGYYLQAPYGDGDPATSDGIFVFSASNDTVNLGDLVRVSGTAAEYQGQTQIASVTGTLLCSSGNSIAPTPVTLPFPSPGYLERFEGMLVSLPQTLYVTEHYLLGRFGQLTLSSGARLQQPTNVVAPGAPALALQAENDLNRILLDDGANDQNPDPIVFGRGLMPLSAANTLRGGDTVAGIVGVMSYTWGGYSSSPNAYRVRPIHALGGGVPDFQPANSRPSDPPAVGGRLRVASMNLLNYFNTFSGCTLGLGGAVTDCRGAENQAEFDRQWPKTVQALLRTNADVIGLVEIENDGYGAGSAIQHLVDRLNAAAGPGSYAFIDADALTGQVNALGTDAIKVGLIYRPAAVTPVGATSALNSVDFVTGGDSANRNRPALAQAFEEVGSGARFVVSVNHLKSKGSACDLPDAGDGQGNCNAVRTNAANLLAAWLAADPTGTGETDALIIGDLNSYAMEDPITAILAAGYHNLLRDYGGTSAYSYVFDAQWGYLDHALASESLAAQVTGAAPYHVNADEPAVLDYNTNYKSAGQLVSLYSPDEFRASDHDPLLIGLNLNRAPLPPVIADVNWPAGQANTYTVPPFLDPDGDSMNYTAALADGSPLPAWLSFDAGTRTFSGTPADAAAGGYTIRVSADDGRGGVASATFTLTVRLGGIKIYLPIIGR